MRSLLHGSWPDYDLAMQGPRFPVQQTLSQQIGNCVAEECAARPALLSHTIHDVIIERDGDPDAHDLFRLASWALDPPRGEVFTESGRYNHGHDYPP